MGWISQPTQGCDRCRGDGDRFRKPYAFAAGLVGSVWECDDCGGCWELVETGRNHPHQKAWRFFANFRALRSNA